MMYYEEKWIDGWLWHRDTIDGPWVTASAEQVIARMRKSLELVVEATNIPEERKSDLAWLKTALLAARGAALNALGR
jgi:hypothetical protein